VEQENHPKKTKKDHKDENGLKWKEKVDNGNSKAEIS
jgi:hypothetical protein